MRGLVEPVSSQTSLASAKEIHILDASEQRLRALGKADSTPSWPTLADRAAMAAATDGIDVVFHTAAVLEGNDVAAYHRVNHTGSEVVASAAAAAGVRRFVHLSSRHRVRLRQG